MPDTVKSKVTNCDLEGNCADRIASVKQHIFVVRQQRVMLDHDLARLYGVTTKQLNQQLKRNRHRFPPDFAFRLTLQEARQITNSRFQNATLKKGQNIKYAPHVFTEHGAIMLASVLNSRVAVQASIYVVRAFAQMRTALMEYPHLARRIDALAEDYDGRFKAVFEAIRQLILTPARPQRPIGFISASARAKKEGKK
jgi:phage regulator Rha-like protein